MMRDAGPPRKSTRVQNKYQALEKEDDEDWPTVDQEKEKTHNEKCCGIKHTIMQRTAAMSQKDKKQKRREHHYANSLACLEDFDSTVEEMICEVSGNSGQPKESWEKIEAAVDSAAVDCVMPRRLLPHIKTRPSARSQAGRHYIAANDAEIKTYGERRVDFMSDEAHKKNIMFQDADVGRTLISVDKLSSAGCEVILKKEGPKIVTASGETLMLKRKGGVFILTMWVKIPDERATSRKAPRGKTVTFWNQDMDLDALQSSSFARQD